jgi:hypothetical protein
VGIFQISLRTSGIFFLLFLVQHPTYLLVAFDAQKTEISTETKMNCHIRHSLTAFLVALMLAVAWLLQWLAILSCNFVTVNTITVTNGSSHNLRTFYPAATSPEFATFYDYETFNVGVFCFADITAVSVFWKFCRTLSIFTIILTTLTVTTSIACLLARISIPVEAARLWWGIGLISAVAALLSAPLFWLDPCKIVEATYRDRFDGTLATIDSTCTPHTGFIEWILQGALQIMVVIITIITKAPWDVVDPTTIEKNDQPAKSLALMEDDEGLENEDDENGSDMRIPMMMEQGHLIELFSDDNNRFTRKSVIELSSSATVGSELSDISIFTHKEAAFGSIPPLLSHDTHSTTSVEGINDGTFNDEDERSNSSGDKENNAPLLYHHKLLIKRKRDKKDHEARSPGGNEYDYIPPPSFELRSSFEPMPQSWSQTSEDVEICRHGLIHSDEAPPKPHLVSMLNPNTFPILVSNSEDDESNYVPHSIFSSSFSQRHWNKNNDQSFDEIWFASDTQSLTGSMVLSPALVEDTQEEHWKLSSHVIIDEEKIIFENTTETETVSLSNLELDYTFRGFIKPSSVTVHVPPLSELNLKLLQETIHDLDEYKNSRTHSDINALAVDSPNIASDVRRKRLKNQSSEGEGRALPDHVSSDPFVREKETAIFFHPVKVHTPTLSRRNRKLLSATEDENKSTCYPTEEPDTSNLKSSECLASVQKLLSPKTRSNIKNPEKHSGLHIPLSPITSSAESKRKAVAASSLVVGTIDRDHFIHMNTSTDLVSNPSFKLYDNNTLKPPCSPISGTRSRVSTADTPRQVLIESEANEKGHLVNTCILVGASPCKASSSPISSFRKNQTCFEHSEDALNVGSKPLHPNTGLFQVRGVERLSSDRKKSLENDNSQYVPESPVMTNVYALLSELKDHVRNQKMQNTQDAQEQQQSSLNLPRLTQVQDFHEQPVERMDSVPYDEVDKSQESPESIIPVSPEQDDISSNSYFVIKPTKYQPKKPCKTGKSFSVVTPDNKMHPIASSTPPRYPRPYIGNRSKNGIVLRQVEMREIQASDPLETLSSNEMEV